MFLLAAKAATMAAKHEEHNCSLCLKSLSPNSLLLPVEDRQNFDEFIEEFFDNSNDDSTSKDEQVQFLCMF